jgi:hypothetical protein
VSTPGSIFHGQKPFWLIHFPEASMHNTEACLTHWHIWLCHMEVGRTLVLSTSTNNAEAGPNKGKCPEGVRGVSQSSWSGFRVGKSRMEPGRQQTFSPDKLEMFARVI